ncbi:MAG: hypothetical protein SGJ19_24350 [Planctomycetia bacterium]|nr:hypothetical protein [Planctomycetia bacterium]
MKLRNRTRLSRFQRITLALMAALVVARAPFAQAEVKSQVRLAAAQATQPTQPEMTPPLAGGPPNVATIQLPLPRLEIDIRPTTGTLPEDIALEYVRGQGQVAGDVGPRWYLSPYSWEAPGLFHRPIYFEDVALERHGRSRCAPLQPVLSAARAAGQFVILPAQMVVHRPLDCVYTLGYGKPRIPPVYPYPWCAPLCHNPYANYPYRPYQPVAPADEVLPR